MTRPARREESSRRRTSSPDAGRAAGKFKMDRALEYAGAGNKFTGYERLEETAKVVALYRDGTPVQQLEEIDSKMNRGGTSGGS